MRKVRQQPWWDPKTFSAVSDLSFEMGIERFSSTNVIDVLSMQKPQHLQYRPPIQLRYCSCDAFVADLTLTQLFWLF